MDAGNSGCSCGGDVGDVSDATPDVRSLLHVQSPAFDYVPPHLVTIFVTNMYFLPLLIHASASAVTCGCGGCVCVSGSGSGSSGMLGWGWSYFVR